MNTMTLSQSVPLTRWDEGLKEDVRILIRPAPFGTRNSALATFARQSGTSCIRVNPGLFVWRDPVKIAS
jgi:hypothetical protein